MEATFADFDPSDSYESIADSYFGGVDTMKEDTFTLECTGATALTASLVSFAVVALF